MTTPNTRSETEVWLKSIGTKFVDVWFLVGGKFIDERHVDDDDTFLTTVTMSLERFRANYALWFDSEMWCLLNRATGDTRRVPTREAAEMIAFHRG